MRKNKESKINKRLIYQSINLSTTEKTIEAMHERRRTVEVRRRRRPKIGRTYGYAS